MFECELRSCSSVYYPVKVQNILNYISLNFLILNRNDNLCFTNSLTLAMKLSELKDCKCFVKVLDAANALFALFALLPVLLNGYHLHMEGRSRTFKMCLRN